MLKKPFSFVTSFFVMQSFPPNVIFRRDLLGPRLSAWNVLLQRIYYSTTKWIRWILLKSSQERKNLCGLHVQCTNPPDVPVDNNNNKLWNLKPFKIKVFGWYLRKWVILPKVTLWSGNGMVVRDMFFFQQNETIKHLFFQLLQTVSLVVSGCGESANQ
jgi:hypothetical protein